METKEWGKSSCNIVIPSKVDFLKLFSGFQLIEKNYRQ